jgi:hypothetical protein
MFMSSGPRAAYLGLVTARDHAAALAVAYEEFEIPSAERRRIIVLARSHA